MTNLGTAFGSPGDDFPDEYFDSGSYFCSDDLQDFSISFPEGSFSDISITPIDSGQNNDPSLIRYKNSLISIPTKQQIIESNLSTNPSLHSNNQSLASESTLVNFLDSSLKNHQSFGDPTRAPKRKVELTHNELTFKDRFYAIFTTKKKFEKKLVKQIHDYIRKAFGFERMSREEFRRIDIYFQNYARYSGQILSYLILHKEEIFDKFLSKSFNDHK